MENDFLKSLETVINMDIGKWVVLEIGTYLQLFSDNTFALHVRLCFQYRSALLFYDMNGECKAEKNKCFSFPCNDLHCVSESTDIAVWCRSFHLDNTTTVEGFCHSLYASLTNEGSGDSSTGRSLEMEC